MNRNGFHENIREGLLKGKRQGHKQNTNEQNSLQKILYGNTKGMKSFSNFRKGGKEE